MRDEKRRNRMRITDYLGKYWAGAEVMYGVIIAMTFTSTLRSSIVNTQELFSTVVFTALFCCIAWGVADGFFYTWEASYRKRNHREMIEASKSRDENRIAYSLIKEDLDDTILGEIDDSDRTKLYQGICDYLSKTSIEEKKKSALKDFPPILFGTALLSGGAGVLVLLPFFILPNNIHLALNISNALGVLSLFTIGFLRPEKGPVSRRIITGTGAAMVGAIIAVITVLLGG